VEVLPGADAQITQLFGEFPADLGLKKTGKSLWEVDGWMDGW